jgi:hypothetical protein
LALRGWHAGDVIAVWAAARTQEMRSMEAVSTIRPAAPARRAAARTTARTCARIAVTAFLAGCGDAGGPVVPDPAGSLSFSYSGAVSGSFTATGELSLLEISPEPQTGAAAMREGDMLVIAASHVRDDGRADLFTITLSGAHQPGAYALDAAGCAQQPPTSCRLAMLLRDVEPAALGRPGLLDEAYIFVLGQVTITALSSARVRGTFHATGFSAAAAGQPPVTLTNGSFDVPVVTP